MTGIEAWSTTAASNNATPPNGAPEGMAPSTVNDTMRNMMAAVRTWYESAQWINLGNTPTYISGTSFSVTGDQTAIYTVGRRIRMVGTTPFTLYGTITASAYVSVTTITVKLDSGSLDNTLSAVSPSIFTTSNLAQPRIAPDYALTTGSSNAYVAAFTPKLAAHKTGHPLNVIFNHSCNGSSTFNPDSLGAIAIKKKGTSDTVTGDIIAGQSGILVYDGTYYQLSSAGALSGTADGPINMADNLFTRSQLKDTAEPAYDLGNISGAVAVDYTNGQVQYGTLTGNISSITVSNWPASGNMGYLSLFLTQDGTGSRTITLSSAYKTIGDLPATLSTTAAYVDELILRSRDAGTTIFTTLNKDYR